ncbi:MAG: thioesterase [Bacteroidetes bacterium]|nr:MAG: thioesterase [Bacteroidota bacterium]
MYFSETSLRVRYAETDQMSFVYYGNYPQYFEVARVEALRTLGLSYKKIEEEGVMLPVLKLEVKYIAPAKYDDLLLIKTCISEIPKTRITFEHEIYNEAGKLLTIGKVELVFVDIKSGKPCRAPHSLINTIEAEFSSGKL